MTPETHFAENDGISIAYQVFGGGPRDLIVIPGWLSNLDLFWEEPRAARFFQALAKFSRVILIDKRGTGLSDRVPPPTIEVQMDDVKAVMDAANSERAAFLGYSEGGAMCMLFAATYPERTSSLILIGSTAREMPDGVSYEDIDEGSDSWLVQIENNWGGPIGIDDTAPSLAKDEKYRQWLAKFFRSSASKNDAAKMYKMGMGMDIRSVLSSISTPTLVLHATYDRTCPIEKGRYLAQEIPNAKLIELDTEDHLPYVGCPGEIVREIQHFLGEEEQVRVTDRVLTTVLFTDIVDSTQLAADLGDEKWSDLLEGHHEAVRRELEIFRGHEVKTTGDGFHATFDGPARSVQCAAAIRESTRRLGLNVRIGIHTGECEVRGESLEGVAIHMAARVSSMAAGGDILVSRTVKDLVAGSGIKFEDFGTHELKGIPDEHQIFKVTAT
jgi:pimeloyl-ACP methyl ester carboxylesterase/class 3 adenylate cyclase